MTEFRMDFSAQDESFETTFGTITAVGENSGVTPNWLAESNQPGHIRNRPFGYMTCVDLLPDTMVTVSSSGNLSSGSLQVQGTPKEGFCYPVRFDGTTYQCVYRDGMLGNRSLIGGTNTEEPFLFRVSESLFFTTKPAGAYAISIYGEAPARVPEEYWPPVNALRAMVRTEDADGSTLLGNATNGRNTHIYGNKVQLNANSGVYINSGRTVVNNGSAIYGISPDGVEKNAFVAQNQSGETSVGYGNYMAKSGNTAIYGHDVLHVISNLASSVGYRPYKRRGDSMSLQVKKGGYTTNSGKDVVFFIPFAMPMVGSPTVTVTSGKGFILRQGGNYTHGSGSSTWVFPDTYEVSRYMSHGIQVTARFSNTTNVSSNDTIGIMWDGTITLS